MARKRLSPARAMFLDEAGGAETPRPGAPPIAQVAGATAAEAALQAVTAELRAAEDEGRMIRTLPLAQIETGHLHRDRLEAEPEALEELTESVRARGQQTPIEVQPLPPGPDGTPRWGLISGWRRVLALRALAEEAATEQAAARFSQALALVRRPEALSSAYVAMVEENEIRAGLSFYERARVVARAVDAGAFDSEKQALQSLFSTAPAPKRSKIKSFLPIVRALDGALRFPARIPERLGLRLGKAVAADRCFAAALARQLARERPDTPEAEAAILAAALKPAPRPAAPPPAGVRMTAKPGRLVLEGAGVDAALAARLAAWLKDQGLTRPDGD